MMRKWTELDIRDYFYRYDMIRNRVSKCIAKHTYRDSGFNFLIYDDEGKKINQLIQDIPINLTKNENNTVIFFEDLSSLKSYITYRCNHINEQINELAYEEEN